MSARKTLTTAPLKFAALAKQRWSSVQDFCVGLADQTVHQLASSGAKHWLSCVIAAVNLAVGEHFTFITARNIL